MDKFSTIPGPFAYADCIEIKVLTESPFQWLTDARAALFFLLEGFKDHATTGAFEKRAAVLNFYSFLFPLPAQWKGGFLKALPVAPDPIESGGVHFIPGGLVIRLDAGLDAEYLERLFPALVELFCFNVNEPTPKVREQFFTLYSGIQPTFRDIVKFHTSKHPATAETI